MKNSYLLLLLLLLVTAQTSFGQDDFYTGLEFNEEYDTVLAVPMMTTRSYSAMPKSYSLKQYCPTPKNQGSQGSCVGWASTYAARTILYARKNGWNSSYSITNNAFSPSYVYNQIKLGYDCSRGSFISSAMNVLKDQGAPKLTDFPYICNKSATYSDKSKASGYKIKDYHRLSYSDYDQNQTVNNVKKALSNGNPVVIGMSIYSSFSYAKGVWNGVRDNYRGGHAMTIIGYDDYKYGGAFEVMNSWGTGWGNDGFIWVRYSDMYRTCKEYFEMVDFGAAPPKPNDPKPVVEKYDLNGSFKLVKSDGSTMRAALGNNIKRDFNVVKSDDDDGSESTYKLTSPQRSGTEFRVYISNEEPAYVYLLGYGTRSGKVAPLYPFQGFSAYLGYKKSNVAIPNEDYYIALDNQTGTDYLCVLYSKNSLDIQSVARRIQSESGSFSDRVKKVLGSQIVMGSNVTFEKYNIEFKAKSGGRSVVPVILEFEHI